MVVREKGEGTKRRRRHCTIRPMTYWYRHLRTPMSAQRIPPPCSLLSFVRCVHYIRCVTFVPYVSVLTLTNPNVRTVCLPDPVKGGVVGARDITVKPDHHIGLHDDGVHGANDE